MGITLFMATGGLVAYLVRPATGSRPLSLIGAFLFLNLGDDHRGLLPGLDGTPVSLLRFPRASSSCLVPGQFAATGTPGIRGLHRPGLSRAVRGGTFVVTAVLAIALLVSGWKRRFRDGFLFLATASAPMVIWMIRNLRLSGLATNREIGFHPPVSSRC